MEKEKLTKEQVTLEMVWESDHSCHDCLWYGKECDNYSKFKPGLTANGLPKCESYTYFD
jgi:hypothetical protein